MTEREQELVEEEGEEANDRRIIVLAHWSANEGE